jgi:hypothetical protein
MKNTHSSLLEQLKLALRRLLKREPPEDPYAYVMAHRKPRPGGRSAAAVLDEPDR